MCADASLDEIRELSIRDVTSMVEQLDVDVEPHALYDFVVQHCTERARQRTEDDG
jgi:hypothetical protein